LKITFQDGREAEITIQQFRVKQYQQAFPLLDDEIGLVAMASGNPRGVIEELHPDSFEQAVAAMKEVNEKGFSTWAGRQMERGAAAMRNLPPDLLEKFITNNTRRTA
jgi:hypothetical protein